MPSAKRQSFSGPEEFVSVVMDLAEPLRLDYEKSIRDQLNPLLGGTIDSLHIDLDRISICYDPTTLSKGALREIVWQAGGKLRAAQNERSLSYS